MKVEIYYETYLFVYFSVGKFISTKDPTGKPYGGEASSYYRLGEKYRLDITNNYKYPEGKCVWLFNLWV